MLSKRFIIVISCLIYLLVGNYSAVAFQQPGGMPPGERMPPGAGDAPREEPLPAEEGPPITEPEPLFEEELEPREPTLEEPVEADEAFNRVYARVGGEVVTKADYRREFGTAEVEPERLKWLIDELLIDVAAEEVGARITAEDVEQMVDQQIGQIKMQAGEEGFQSQLQREGLTEEEFREQMAEELQRQQKLSAVLFSQYPELQPEEGEPASASPTRPRARIMLLESNDTAEKVYTELEKGAEWEAVFEEKSEKLGFMGEAGDLGWFDWGQWGRELEFRIFKLPLFGISEPFEFRGYNTIIQKTGSRLVPPWEEISIRSRETWRNYRLEYYQEKLLELLREEYAVYVPSDLGIDLSNYGQDS